MYVNVMYVFLYIWFEFLVNYELVKCFTIFHFIFRYYVGVSPFQDLEIVFLSDARTASKFIKE